MTVRVDTNWRYRDFQVISLENKYLRLDIFPELGANIYNVIDKPSDHNFLWHNPRVIPHKVPFGGNYDDNFYGGWDDIFPNDPPEQFDAETYPDHGEIWCQPWNYEITEQTSQRCAVRFWVYGRVTQSLVEKWVSLEKNERRIGLRYRFTNLGQKPQSYLWKLHPALFVNERHRIDLPAKSAELGPCLSRPRGQEGQVYEWPFLTSGNQRHEISQALPIDSQVAEMHFATELNQGWCALTDTETKLGFGLAFDKEVFSTVWLFMTYGGWRGLNTVILEPSTGYPHHLRDAKARGRLARLEGGVTLETQVTAVIYEGVSGVGKIERDGHVHPL
ncbi:MAG: DUF5107 domain-containing protein [Chloracidobacterium sp.]|nr:DUF5107 domain-containing protein [Chloracidobacterium sp.]